jgi:hypothetical protein
MLNLESGVLRALKSYKMEKGLSDQVATKWATDNLKTGVSRFQAVMVKHRQDGEAGLEAAYADLRAWAQS